MLSKDQILNLPLKKITVRVPEWSDEKGDTLTIIELSGGQRDAFEMSVASDGKVDLMNIRAKLCALTIVDDSGNRLFDDSEILALSGTGSKVLDRLFAISQKLSGISKDDIKEYEKNSAAIQNEDLHSN
jgi:hypothetical protein